MPMRIGGAALVAASALVAAVAICAPATVADGLAAAHQRLAPQLAGDPLVRLTAGDSAYMPVSQPAAVSGAPAGWFRKTSIYVIILRERVPERRGA